jgi:SAM-dependent MidA family methyltransferase
VNALRQRIEREIRELGPIPFSRYMELCLYDADLGYYSRHAEQFGKGGDFYTSSDVHKVFGRLMARQFEEMWRTLGSPAQITIVELGPGRGLFAQDVLEWAEKKFPDFFGALRYLLVESSPALRERIEVTLSTRFESGKAAFASREEFSSLEVGNAGTPARSGTAVAEERNKLCWLEEITKATTILFANEFFDALPVEILSSQGSLQIDTRDGRFIETWAQSTAQELDFLDHHSVHPEPGERIEVPLNAQNYMHHVARTMDRGFLIAIDYGYTRDEQLAGRHRSTLKAIRQHSISANPYEAPGEQDITVDVNFTALAAAAKQNGMQPQKLITQSQFLMGIGEATQFSDAFEDCRLPQEHAKVALQLKHLVTPAGMGESFHVMVAGKGMDTQAIQSLAGMNFGRAR